MTLILCHICEETLDAPNLANCLACHRDFHLQMRTDVPGKDCGDVWVHEEHLHLVFGCRECIDAGQFGGGLGAGEVAPGGR